MFTHYHQDKSDPCLTTTFEVHGVDLSIVNAIRRILLTDIPCIGFRGEEDPSLEILRNDGPLHNEFMLHRFGLLPIHFTEEETESFQADDYTFEMDVENTGAAVLNVTTQDFKVVKNGRTMSSSEVARLFPANAISKDHILMTRLRRGEGLHVKGYPVLETARTHAGFGVACTTFSYMPDAVQAAKATNLLDKERAYQRNTFGEPVAFQFQIEPYRGLSVRYLMLKALEILRQKIKKTETELFTDPSEYITLQEWKSYDAEEPAHSTPGPSGYEFVFQHEDDTLGNLLQSLLYNMYVREGKPTEHGHRVTYVGYVCPHPLESTMILRVVFEKPAPLSEYITMLSESCRRIHADLQTMETEWMRLNMQ